MWISALDNRDSDGVIVDRSGSVQWIRDSDGSVVDFSGLVQ